MITVTIKALNGTRTVSVTDDDSKAVTWNDVIALDAMRPMFMATPDRIAPHLKAIDGNVIPDNFREVILDSAVSNNSVAEIDMDLYDEEGQAVADTENGQGLVIVYTAGGLQATTIVIQQNVTTVADILKNDDLALQSGLSPEELEECAVMVNYEAVQATDKASTVLHDGDSVTLTVCKAYSKGL